MIPPDLRSKAVQRGRRQYKGDATRFFGSGQYKGDATRFSVPGLPCEYGAPPMSRVPLNSPASTASDRQTSIRPAGLNDQPARVRPKTTSWTWAQDVGRFE